MRGIGVGLTALALVLAGCGGGAYDWRAVEGGGAGLPEVAMTPSEEIIVPPGRGAREGVALRTFVASGEGWSEVTGATCDVTALPYFRTRVRTPVRIVVPDLGPDAPPLRADCETPSSWGSDTVAPVYAWPADRMAGPVARAWWGGGWWRGYQKSGPLRYPDLAVGLVPRPATTP
jgi:hypothetical protein